MLTKVHIVQSYGFSSSHIQMWELDHKQGWASKKWCFQTVGEDSWESLGQQGDQTSQFNSKGYQPWIFIEKTEAEAEPPIIWPHDAKSWLTGKYHDAGKDWRPKEKKAAEDEMVSRQHHRLNGYEFEETLGDSEGQRSLMCYSLWGHKELDVT